MSEQALQDMPPRLKSGFYQFLTNFKPKDTTEENALDDIKNTNTQPLKRSASQSDNTSNAKRSKASVIDTNIYSVFSEAKFDQALPKSIGFLDLQKIEHAAKNLQKSIRLILNQCPDSYQVDLILNDEKTDNGTKVEIQENQLILLASKLQSKYKLGELDLFNEILKESVTLSDEQLAKLKELDETDNQKVEITLPQVPTHGIHQKGIDNSLPKLPDIQSLPLYERVFIHKSTVNSKTHLNPQDLINSHNERLEFFGDSILNNLVTIILFKEFPYATEGQLSKLRADLINNKVLTQIAMKYGFDRKLKSRVNEHTLKNGDQKIYADVFEAYIGALGIERGLDLEEITQWLTKLYRPMIDEHKSELFKEPLNKDAKTELYALIGRADLYPVYDVIQTGDGISKDFVVDCKINNELLGRGTGLGSKEASCRAAMIALKNGPILEKYHVERKKIEQPVKLERMQRMEMKKLEKEKKREEQRQMELDSTLPPPSPIRASMFPIKVDPSMEIDPTAKNEIYAEIGRCSSTSPQYQVVVDGDQFVVTLHVRGVTVATTRDPSKKRAQSKLATALKNNAEAFKELTKRFVEKTNDNELQLVTKLA